MGNIGKAIATVGIWGACVAVCAFIGEAGIYTFVAAFFATIVIWD